MRLKIVKSIARLLHVPVVTCDEIRMDIDIARRYGAVSIGRPDTDRYIELLSVNA